ncbi:toxin-antitoxin system YwqK family antitoxin [Haliscomenobacter hydrossis]|uniref:MORN variant repeat-containing protein n=1 Tax=Haliscomenobacter hydrossis (strain ATCC 27775 / DSM 1100 / LMG 10767 / O) TaxID=760192 RepID=F4L695_HALH1|nr:toxin-antitoxin system YwqK family antitoxin [Haliscomenobacter hydrossis]AEE54113.1 MORN variant repeat-containing protein [Haliscomenobacter hydrossis DSM 1100]
MRHSLLFLTLLCFGLSCQQNDTAVQNTSSEAKTLDQDGQFSMVPIPASSHQLAQKKGSNAELIEEGITDAKGMKNGIWVTYQGEGAYPAKIVSYVNGLYNGPYFEFDGFGRMAVRANYMNNKLHGLLVKFNSGTLAQESSYINGVLDGVYKEFNQKGAVEKEIHYKDGKLDGLFRYYDEDGKVTLEYQYKNGKQQ